MRISFAISRKYFVMLYVEDDTNSIATEGRDTDSYRETDSLDAYEATVEEMQEPEAEPQHIPVPKNPTKMDKMR